jgi:hypothetical protein
MGYRSRCDARRASKRKNRGSNFHFDVASATEVLKTMYPMHASPTWSPCIYGAYKRNWITWEQLQEQPKWDVRPGLCDLAYAKYPFFSFMTSNAKDS